MSSLLNGSENGARGDAELETTIDDAGKDVTRCVRAIAHLKDNKAARADGLFKHDDEELTKVHEPASLQNMLGQKHTR